MKKTRETTYTTDDRRFHYHLPSEAKTILSDKSKREGDDLSFGNTWGDGEFSLAYYKLKRGELVPAKFEKRAHVFFMEDKPSLEFCLERDATTGLLTPNVAIFEYME